MNQNIIFIGLIEEGSRRNLLRFTKSLLKLQAIILYSGHE